MEPGGAADPVVRTVLVMIAAMIISSLGDTSFSEGMKAIGDVSLQLRALPRLIARVASSRYILAGVGFQMFFLGMWLAVLSWADLSVALPLTSLSYVSGTLLARFYLHERVGPLRWGGTALVCLGVALVARSMG